MSRSLDLAATEREPNPLFCVVGGLIHFRFKETKKCGDTACGTGTLVYSSLYLSDRYTASIDRRVHPWQAILGEARRVRSCHRRRKRNSFPYGTSLPPVCHLLGSKPVRIVQNQCIAPQSQAAFLHHFPFPRATMQEGLSNLEMRRRVPIRLNGLRQSWDRLRRRPRFGCGRQMCRDFS